MRGTTLPKKKEQEHRLHPVLLDGRQPQALPARRLMGRRVFLIQGPQVRVFQRTPPALPGQAARNINKADSLQPYPRAHLHAMYPPVLLATV